MTEDEVVKALVEQVVAMGFKIRLMTLDAGFYTVDVLNFVSQFKYVIAVPVGDVKVYQEFDGEYETNSKRQEGRAGQVQAPRVQQGEGQEKEEDSSLLR